MGKDKKYEGRIPDLSNDEYHAAPGISSSLLKAFASANTPRHFYVDHVQKQKVVSDGLQEAFDVGAAVHTGFLEPHLFDGKFVVFDDAEIVFKIGGKNPRGTNDYKAWKANFLTENEGKTVMTGDTAAQVKGMVESLRSNSYLQKIMTSGNAEHSFFFRYTHSPFLCKCRPDYLRDDGFLMEFKTTEDASNEAFSKQIASLGYHIQAAHYLDGVRTVVGTVKQFIFIAIEKRPPYGVACYAADADMVNIGRLDVQTALGGYGRCVEKDEWPCYPESAQFICMPRWAKGAR